MDMMPAPVCFKSSDSSSSNCPLDQTSNQMVSVDITNAIGFSKELKSSYNALCNSIPING